MGCGKMGRMREPDNRSAVVRLMETVAWMHATCYGVEHPMTLGRARRGRMRDIAHRLIRKHGQAADWWTGALREFYADGYWSAFGHQLDAFVRQSARYIEQARRAEHGQGVRSRAEAEFERDLQQFGQGGCGIGTGR